MVSTPSIKQIDLNGVKGKMRNNKNKNKNKKAHEHTENKIKKHK